MQEGETYLSRERHEEIGHELEMLKSEGRQRIAERLKQSKELGDLSENSDYQEAREEQLRLEQRIRELEELLRKSVIIKRAGGGVLSVRVGTHVRVRKEGKEDLVYSIVGSDEAKPADGLISNESPLGQALIGKKVGDDVEVTTPRGIVRYAILSIE